MDGAQGGNMKMSRLSSALPPDELPTQSDKLLFDLPCRSRRVPVTDLLVDKTLMQQKKHFLSHSY